MFVFRGWGGHLSPHLIRDSLGLSGTCADSIEVDARGGAWVDAARSRGLTGGLGRKCKSKHGILHGIDHIYDVPVAIIWAKRAVGGLQVV
eukprot:7389910-Prymnesium_polylepis.1